jgi:hypothetical protein
MRATQVLISDSLFRAPKQKTAQSGLPTAIEVFTERVEARALLVENGLLDLQTAVDTMQETAAAQGLVEQCGQDQIQQILSDAFARWR